MSCRPSHTKAGAPYHRLLTGNKRFWGAGQEGRAAAEKSREPVFSQTLWCPLCKCSHTVNAQQAEHSEHGHQDHTEQCSHPVCALTSRLNTECKARVHISTHKLTLTHPPTHE